jgi:ribosome-associated toxin RatA of RatAB toxin-antitoxin module
MDTWGLAQVQPAWHMPAPVTSALAVLFVLAAEADDVAKRLDSGDVVISTEKVEGSDLPRSIAMGVIDAPPEKVWALVTDCDNFYKTMPRIAASKVIERDGGTVVCRVTADLPFPVPDLTSETRAIMTVEPGVKWERRWSLIKGDYRANTGAWVLTPYKGDLKRTLARYELHIDPKIHVPDSFIVAGQKKSLPDLFTRLREQTK